MQSSKFIVSKKTDLQVYNKFSKIVGDIKIGRTITFQDHTPLRLNVKKYITIFQIFISKILIL